MTPLVKTAYDSLHKALPGRVAKTLKETFHEVEVPPGQHLTVLVAVGAGTESLPVIRLNTSKVT